MKSKTKLKTGAYTRGPGGEEGRNSENEREKELYWEEWHGLITLAVVNDTCSNRASLWCWISEGATGWVAG